MSAPLTAQRIFFSRFFVCCLPERTVLGEGEDGERDGTNYDRFGKMEVSFSCWRMLVALVVPSPAAMGWAFFSHKYPF